MLFLKKTAKTWKKVTKINFSFSNKLGIFNLYYRLSNHGYYLKNRLKKNIMFRIPLFLSLFLMTSFNAKSSIPTTPDAPQNAISTTKMVDQKDGFFNFIWDEKKGTIRLEIDKFDTEFLYVNSLPAGMGSNDIGLDRGQLGATRIVKFVRVGDKVLMIQPNYDYRAVSDNPAESESVEQAFAQSVIWGFKIDSVKESSVMVDATAFLLRDAHQVINRLEQNKEGAYKIDKTRSAIYPEGCKNFPKNTEFEATITFVGKAKGRYLRSVTPSSDALTLRMHHSLVELPDADYSPRIFDPRSGYNSIAYQDYATPIDQPLVKKFIRRHRLEKKDPTAAMSEAVEPIIYYVDRGAPEPIRSALIKGASWWNQAFEAAGYKDAFQVKVLPDNVDPMDVRYNVIQWVHRSTRGWSYGSSVTDPRTGEIIKGHVSLGSLRVRQDFLIAQGLVKAYEEGKPASPKMLEMALARLRQLAAHEVGHTIGLAHNFAASTNDRSSVMDYPHPYITANKDGSLNFEDAYDDKIGAWDKRTILFGYQDFPKGTDHAKALLEILKENQQLGLRYISDADARPAGSAHPYAHLWDNGNDPVSELNRLMEVRAIALKNFSVNNIPMNTPLSNLEEVLVPLYLAHRYQVEAAVKVVGGVDYEYSARGDTPVAARIVDYQTQIKAISSLMKALSSKELAISKDILLLIPPKTFDSRRTRESFKSRTGLTFDPMAAAESAANHLISLYMHPQRATRLVEQHARDQRNPGLDKTINALIQATWLTDDVDTYLAEIGRVTEKLVLQHLMKLAMNEDASEQVRAICWQKLVSLKDYMKKNITTGTEMQQAHIIHSIILIDQFNSDPMKWKSSMPKDMPDGSPIGMDACGGHF